MLPKQRIFFDKVLDKNGPKYVAFISGVGGGKTITGCVTMLAQAVMYPSTYLIARQYYPELKATTYRTFKDICPPELILEDRIADMEIRIKAVNGKSSTILFRPLEAWDKLRSLNLGGFFIDEASQVSEEAFMLLQGRLRDSGGLRKGICISNPAGHDWLYRWFFKQDFFKNEQEKRNYFLIKGTSLENTFLPKDYIETMLNTWSDIRIQREVMGSFDVFEGAIYDEFRRDVHVIDDFEIPSDWRRVMGADHGWTNPAAAVFGAVDGDGNVYIYDEYYAKEKLIREIVQEGWLPKIGRDKIDAIYIDPSTKATRGQTGLSDFSTYLEYLPDNLALLTANNEVSAGIDRVKTYLRINPRNNKPRLYIFKRCVNLIEELVQYRWAPLSPSQEGQKNQKEEPRKYNDHACDALRYLIMSRPDPSRKPEKLQGWPTLGHSIQKELDAIRNPKPKDPFQDY
jgi:phage terminase large subunit